MNQNDALRKRYWLLQNMDWFMEECVYHRDNKINFSESTTTLWELGQTEGQAVILDEITK